MMDTGTLQPTPLNLGPETKADCLARIEREKAIVAKAEADIAAGLGIDDDDLQAWFDALEHDPHTPMPAPRYIPTLR